MAVLSGVLYFASLPPFDVGFLAWIALIPLLIVFMYARYLQAFLSALLMGTTFFALHMQWLNVVPSLPSIAFFAIGLYTGLFFGLFGLLSLIIVQRTRFLRAFVIPALWVAIEYTRSNLSFLSIPLGLIGHSQHDNTAIIQISSFSSVYGVSFLIILINTTLADGLLWVLNRLRIVSVPRLSGKVVFSSLAGAFIITFIVYFWGEYQVRTLGSAMKGIVTASLIQGNIPQGEKWDLHFRKKIIERYSELTLKASQETPDIIIWPESSTPGYLRTDPMIYQSVSDLVKKTGIPLLLGSSSHAKMGQKGKVKYRLVNGAFLITGSGKIVSSYYKTKLVPFGEYPPLEGRFSWPQWLVPESGIFLPGTFHKVFEIPQGRFGVVICWENLFPDLFRKFVDKGSQFMVNLTNEAWFGKTAASSQFLSMSVFRAVENRVSLLRCANTGITSLIDPLGRVMKKVMDEKGNDIMVKGILTVSVPAPLGPTVYTKHGDLFAIACTAVALFFLFSSLLPLRIRQILRISGKSCTLQTANRLFIGKGCSI